MFRRRFFAMVFVITSVVGLAALTSGAGSTSSEPSSPPGRLKALLKERRDTLRQLVEILETQHQNGTVTLDTMVRASNQLLEAELELAESGAERIAILEKMVENLRQLERLAEAGHQAARVTFDAVLEAKAARLQVEIRLVREKNGGR